MRGWAQAVAFVCVGAVTLLAAAPSRADWQRLKLGACELTLDPGTDEGASEAVFVACLRGSVGSEITTVSGTPEENVWARYGSVYAGVHIGPWLSANARGYARDLLPLGKDASERRDHSLDYAVVQLGNPAMHRVWASAGRMRLPFGIDVTQATEHYRARETRAFWESPPEGGMLSLDDTRTWRVDLGYATDEYERQRARQRNEVPLETESVHAASFRISYDISALDGSRLIGSGYGENRGQRRYGFGFLNTGRRGDTTLFEFVRLQVTPGREYDFQQILRAGYISSWRSASRLVFQFDDERFRARMGMGAYDLLLWDHVILRLAIAHYKSESGDKKRRWTVTSGLEAQL